MVRGSILGANSVVMEEMGRKYEGPCLTKSNSHNKVMERREHADQEKTCSLL
jgi:hypothetical protein